MSPFNSPLNSGFSSLVNANANLARSTMSDWDQDPAPKSRKHIWLDLSTFVTVLLPSFLAVLFPKEEARDWPVLVADVTLLLLIAGVMRFITQWPCSWVDHLTHTRARLLNYANSIKIGMGSDPFSSEVALNRQVFLTNLLLARKLQTLERLGWILSISGTLSCAALMLWARGHIAVSEDRQMMVFNDVNVYVFVMWGLLKTAILLSSRAKSFTQFEPTASSASEFVTEANLSIYVALFQENVRVRCTKHKRPTQKSAKVVKKRPRFLGDVELKRLENNSNEAELCLVDTKEVLVPPKLKELFVSVTPYPLDGSPTLTFYRNAEVKILPTIDEASEDTTSLQHSEFFQKGPAEIVTTANYEANKENPGTKYSISGVPVATSVKSFLTRLVFRNQYAEDITSTTHIGGQRSESLTLLKNPTVFDPIIQMCTILKEYANDPNRVSPKELLHSLRLQLIELREAVMKRSLCKLQTQVHTFHDLTLKGFMFESTKRGARLIRMALVRIPISAIKLSFLMLMVVPRFIMNSLKTSVIYCFHVEPVNDSSFRTYRLTHGR